LRLQKPTPGYCVFIDLVDSVALKDNGIVSWCDVMCNVISSARAGLDGIDGEAEPVGGESGSPLIEPHGLQPLKVIGDCVMFYIPKRSMPAGADALTIFGALVNIIRVPKGDRRCMRPEVRVVVTSCEEVRAITFVKCT
jgi:hypothetical protein